MSDLRPANRGVPPSEAGWYGRTMAGASPEPPGQSKPDALTIEDLFEREPGLAHSGGLHAHLPEIIWNPVPHLDPDDARALIERLHDADEKRPDS